LELFLNEADHVIAILSEAVSNNHMDYRQYKVLTDCSRLHYACVGC
jgi:hypothetical protein